MQTGFETSEGYVIDADMDSQQGWTAVAGGDGEFDVSTISNQAITTSPAEPVDYPLFFTGTGYARMQASADSGIARDLDLSGVNLATEQIDAVNVSFDWAWITNAFTSTNITGSVNLVLDDGVGGDVVVPLLSYNRSNSLGSRVFSRLLDPDGTVWSGDWDGDSPTVGGSWAYQDSVRATFSLDVTETGITGGFEVLDDYTRNTEFESDDSFTYNFAQVIDLDQLKRIEFLGTSSGKFLTNAVDELSIVATTSAAAANGDFDEDGDVDGNDFLLWQRGGSPDPLSAADLTLWEADYGANSPLAAAVQAVPEPASWILVCTMAIAATRRRRTHRGIKALN